MTVPKNKTLGGSISSAPAHKWPPPHAAAWFKERAVASTHYQGSYRSLLAGFIWFGHPSLLSYPMGWEEVRVKLHETKALTSKRSRKNSYCSFVKKWRTSGNLRPLPSLLPSPAHSQHTPSKCKHALPALVPSIDDMTSNWQSCDCLTSKLITQRRFWATLKQ